MNQPETPLPQRTEETEVASPSFTSRALLACGIALLVAWGMWVAVALINRDRVGDWWPHTPAIPEILKGSSGFTSNVVLTEPEKADIQKQFDAAWAAAEELNRRGRMQSDLSQYADWAAFCISSLITLLAGYFGKSMVPADTTHLDIKDAAQLIAQAAEENSKKKGRPAKKRPLSRRVNVASVVGVLAALATIATVTSNRFQIAASKNAENSSKLGDAIVQARKAAERATSRSDLNDAIENLKKQVLLIQP